MCIRDSMYYIALVPCVISSLIAHGIASYFNVTNEFFAIENIPDFTILNSVKISVLAILCALVSLSLIHIYAVPSEADEWQSDFCMCLFLFLYQQKV